MSQNRCNLLIKWWSFGICPVKNASYELETSNQCCCFFNCYYISFQDTQSYFFEFLVSVINHFHINGSRLFCDSFEWILSLYKYLRKIFFSFLSKVLRSRINCCYKILFSNLKQKDHDIIISWVLNIHMILLYIETPYINIILFIALLCPHTVKIN